MFQNNQMLVFKAGMCTFLTAPTRGKMFNHIYNYNFKVEGYLSFV